MEQKYVFDSKSKFPFAYEEFSFNNWIELRNYLVSWKENHTFENYVFRGHSKSSWELIPTLERIRPNIEDCWMPSWYIHAEELSVGNFQRAIHLFANQQQISNIYKPSNNIDWLSIMQHHGAATRLLDVSLSPLIAAFFAFADINNAISEKCIWALPLSIIDQKNESLVELKTDDKFQELYEYYQDLKIGSGDGKDMIGYSFLKNPSERPYHQQAAFIYSMSNKKTFSSLLGNYYDNHFTCAKKLILNITNRAQIADVINDLKLMNITYSSLFPGIDGYSKDILLYQYIVNT